MSKEKPKRVVLHGCYSVKNSILGIRDRNGNLMSGEHNVFIIKVSKDRKRVKVKTITSLENISSDGKRVFHNSALESVRNGEIVVIPMKSLMSRKLSGVHRRGIWIYARELYKPNFKYRFPKEYEKIIIKDYRGKK